jgi:uncharacterized membrane protein
MVLLLVFSLMLAALIPLASSFRGGEDVIQIYLNSIRAPGLGAAVQKGLGRRLTKPGAWLTLLILGAAAVGILWKAKTGKDREVEKNQSVGKAHHFSLLLVLAGTLLVVVPEFIFLRDFFGYRINTIFKFYYQAWLMWSVAAAFGTVLLFQKLRLPWSTVFSILIFMSLTMALVYPVLGLWSRTNGFNPLSGKTLDGAVQFKEFSPDDSAAASWLANAPYGVVAESVGGSYSSHARISTYSGLPAILGWDGHENQWRGSSELVTPRKEEVRRLYCTRQWPEAERILNNYNVKYVVVGSLEYATYTRDSESCPGGLSAEKFSEHMQILFRQGQVTVYGR